MTGTEIARKDAAEALERYPHESSKDLIGCCRPMTDILYTRAEIPSTLTRRARREDGGELLIATQDLPGWEHCPWCGTELGSVPLRPSGDEGAVRRQRSA